jgi:xylulokinase
VKVRRVVGVDIGTQGTKAALYSADGTLEAESFVPSKLLRPEPGAVEEDPERQYASVLAAIRGCIEKSGIDGGSVEAVAIDGQMAGVIGVGADGSAVTPYDSWLDVRCAPYIRLMADRAGSAILRSAGNGPSFNHGPKILFWKGERPEAWKRIVSFVQPGGYAAMRLCGLSGSDAFIDDTYLHFSGFADNAGRRWNDDLCREFDVPVSRLPAIVRPADLVGRVTAAAASASGLRAGTPVAAGLGDTAASFLSCGAASEGVCVDVAGTASVFATTVSRFRPDDRSGVLGVGRAAVEGLWHPYAYVNGGGMDLLWFARELAGGLRGGTGADRLSASFEELDAMIAELPLDPEDPYFVPHMEGRVMPSDPGLRGAWAGLSRSHGLPHLYRAVLESVALEYGIYLRAARELHPETPMRQVRATGGGARNAAWNRVKADVLGVPVAALAASPGAPAGAAMVAAAAVGLVSDLAATAAAWSGAAEAVEPDPSLRAHYDGRLENYERLLCLLSNFPERKEFL